MQNLSNIKVAGAGFKLRWHYLPLYQINGLNLRESVVYSRLINMMRISVAHGLSGRNGKKYYSTKGGYFYVVTRIKNLEHDPLIQTKKRTLIKIFNDLENKGFIIRHKKEHHTEIELPPLNSTINKWLINKAKTRDCSNAKVPINSTKCKKCTSQSAKNAPQYKRNLTKNKLNHHISINTNNNQKPRNKYYEWISKTHQCYGLNIKSLEVISHMCNEYHMDIKGCKDMVNYIVEARNQTANKFHMSPNDKRERFESNNNIKSYLPIAINRILDYVFGKLYAKHSHNLSDYAGYIVNSLKGEFMIYFDTDNCNPNDIDISGYKKHCLRKRPVINNPKQARNSAKELHDMERPQTLHPTPKSVQIKLQKQLKALNDPNRKINQSIDKDLDKVLD